MADTRELNLEDMEKVSGGKHHYQIPDIPGQNTPHHVPNGANNGNTMFGIPNAASNTVRENTDRR